MSFGYKKALVIGATSGIGRAIAEKLVQNGISTIIAGRRKENLDDFVRKYGSDKAQAEVVDILRLDEIPHFASDVTTKNPDLDFVFINAGIQRPFDFANPASVDLDIFDQEFLTNYTAAVRLTKAFLPHLQKQPHQTALAYTTSQMALVPMLRSPGYGASKAALHHFILALRAQLREGPGDVRVVEVYPPAVQTELHDAKHQPDLKDGHLIGMPLAEFTKETWTALVEGKDQIAVGSAKEIYDAFEGKRQVAYGNLTEALNVALKQFVR